MNRVVVSPLAKNDLQDIRKYISSELENPLAAEKTLAQIIRRISELESFSNIGASLSSITKIETDYRYLVSGSYIIFYRSKEKTVYVDRILFGKRDYLSILFGDQVCEGLE